MALHGKQIKQLCTALTDAFTRDELRRMVALGMNLNLDYIVPAGPLSNQVFELVMWAERHDRIGELVAAAVSANPGNPELQLFAADYRGWIAGLEPLPGPSTGLEEQPGTVAALIARARTERSTVLNLSNHDLAAVPPGLSALADLTELDLSGNRLEMIPLALAQLGKLQILNLARNQLAEFPAAITAIPSLRVLDLSQNRIGVLPPALGSLTELQSLNLAENELAELPAAIGALAKLQTLDVNNNALVALPPTIGKLAELRDLILTGNQLEALPESFGDLRLLELDLSDNRFVDFPLPVTRVISLSSLRMDRNRLQDLPLELTKMGRLRSIDFARNPFQQGAEFLASVTDAQKLFAFLRQQANSRKRELNEAKVIIVGEATVGKTSLVNRLLGYKYNPHEDTTRRIDITPWAVTVGSRQIKVNIWDFGGQHIMHATHQFFLTKRSVYVLVVDGRLGEQASRLEYWLKLIRSFGGDSPILVVCNKADQNRIELNWTDLTNRYGVYAFVKACSCADPPREQGIDEVRQQIAAAIASLPLVSDSLYESWFAVKAEIESRQRTANYLSYDTYREIAAGAGVTERVDQETLLSYLRDLGVVLWFGEDPRLADTNVINPRWLILAVYGIINSNILFQQKGKVVISQLRHILEDPDHLRKIPFIVDVMRRFELCFAMDCAEGECILVPALLQQDEPFTGDWRDCLQFEIKYDPLPNSIISRLIVRLNSFILQNVYWRSGAVFAKDEVRALVRSEEANNRIRIFIKGPKAERVRFLEVIRSELRAVHATILNIMAVERVPVPGTMATVSYPTLLTHERLGLEMIVPEGLEQPVRVRDLLEGVDPPEKQEAARQAVPESSAPRMPDHLLDLTNQLTDRLVSLNLAETYESRSALLRGVRGADTINRITFNVRIDLDQIMDQLWNRPTRFDEQHPFWRLIDNAVRYLGGAETSYAQELLDLRTDMERVYRTEVNGG